MAFSRSVYHLKSRPSMCPSLASPSGAIRDIQQQSQFDVVQSSKKGPLLICANTATGHAAAAPPRSVIKLRGACVPREDHALCRGTLFKFSGNRPRKFGLNFQKGHVRFGSYADICDANTMSTLPPKADICNITRMSACANSGHSRLIRSPRRYASRATWRLDAERLAVSRLTPARTWLGSARADRRPSRP